MFPQDDVDAADGFWKNVLGDDQWERINDESFATGFCEGALDVWHKAEC
jgi:hypothetical protein